MMKHLTLICFSIGLFLTGKCHAEFKGFYLGQSFGSSFSHAQFINSSSSVATFGLPHTLTLESHTKSNKQYFWGELYGGWGCTYFDKLYLGLRAGVNLANYNIKNRSSSSLSQTLSPSIPISSTITNKPNARLWLAEVTLDQKIGWVFCKQGQLFALVGVAINNPRLKGSSVASDTGGGGTPFDGTVDFSLSKKGQYAHFRWGFGLEYQFLCNWGLQLLYTHTNYGNISFSGSGVDSDGSGESLTATTSIKCRIHRQVFSIGFVRYF